MSLQIWLAFVGACLIISFSPGPGCMASVSAGLAHGWLQALKLVAGLQLALFLQMGLVATGLGALLVASPSAFLTVKLVGAGYLIWLGFGLLRQSGQALQVDEQSVPREQLLWRGLLVNMSNPKAIVFMLALVPQFIDESRPQLLQFGILTATMVVIDFIVMGGYAGAAAHFRRWLATPLAQRWSSRLFGSAFILLGLLTLWPARG
ncbi:MAG: hypothetical protein RIR00_1457 [Pseudomonadota bacterium]|jgi:homoserine/homoserine lactone efflux protein